MKRVRSLCGFTLLEMLTTLAIIALLIGLLLPALAMIQKSALNVKQKSQFHAIEIAMEAFSADVGDYPPSSYTKTTGSGPGGDNTGYCGAQKLAEAIIGWDGFGFHPKSQWRSDGTASIDSDVTPELIYDVTNGITSTDGSFTQSADDNLKARKGPYLELEKANAVKVSSLYPVGHDIYNVLAGDTYVFCDMFTQVKNLGTGKKTGMPILYFRANTDKKLHKPASPIPTWPWDPAMSSVVYNVNENFPFFMYPAPWGNFAHPLNDRTLFYDRTKNPNFLGTAANNFRDARPYRAQSFLLLSAGSDGLYGTADDVYNIDENDK